MRYEIVPVKNVARLAEAGNALIQRPPGMPGMGLIHAPTGFGKSTASTWFVVRCHGVFVRALQTSSPMSLLGSIRRELDIEPRGSCADTVGQIVVKLAETRRPLFIDEANYVVENKRLINTLRDIHDLSTVPVILIGKPDMPRKIAADEQLAGRIAQRVEFFPLDMDDATLMAERLCEVKVERELIERIHDAAGGSVRLIVVGLGAVESWAKTRGPGGGGKKEVLSRDWPKDRDFFLSPLRRGAPK